jgi:hypothetical protein
MIAATAVALFTIFSGGTSSFPVVRVTGNAQMVFDWSSTPCDPIVTPDAPVRAFRDADGRVQLILARYVNSRMVGPGLDRLRPTCDETLGSAYSPNPANFADKEWITATYTPDGKKVYALVHDEYHGWEHPGRCAPQVTYPFRACWYNAVTLAVSTDGGRSFERSQPPTNLVASIPYRYTSGIGPAGIFQPSNIVYRASDRYFYVLVFVQRYENQERGVCVMRTRNLADPASWRAWDGNGYDVSFVDPYRVPPGSATDHVCKPVSQPEIQGLTQSLTYSTYYRKFLLVGTAQKLNRGSRKQVFGVYFSLSSDLIHWSDRQLILETVTPGSYKCGGPNPLVHPSVLDPDSGDRNFGTTGTSAYLYLTRLNYQSCTPSPDFDLIRFPIRFSK